jgi:6-phosphogluconolactonase
MSSEPDVIVEPSPEELAERSAGRLVATLVAALGVRPVAHLGLTGGGILEQVMRAVRDLPARDSVEWHRVHVWWADERYVPADSDERNDKAAFAALLEHLPLDPALIHRMPASDSPYGEDVEAAAAAYAAELAAAYAAELAAAYAAELAVATPPGLGGDVPHFDALLLGIGPDGHCASLFPEHPGVYEQEAAVIAVRNSPKPPPNRLSLTFRALDAANEVWFIASGEGKAKAVAMALSGADRVQVPSAGPRGRERTLWLIDEAAAAQLPPRT